MSEPGDDPEATVGGWLAELHTVGVGTGCVMHARHCSLEEATEMLVDDAHRRGIAVVTLAGQILEAGLD